MKETQKIAFHTTVRGSWRVGRTSAGRALDKEALRFAVIAAVRHNHTDYASCRPKVWSALRARENVREGIEAILKKWPIA